MGLVVVPIELEEANALVARWHRHHQPVQGHRFSIGALDVASARFVGAAIIARPVARMVNARRVLEVTRCVTDGTPNACSLLYGAAARIAKAAGFAKVQTYILESEQGVSLKAAGWKQEASVKGRQWKHTDGRPRRTDQPTCDKTRWCCEFAAAAPTDVVALAVNGIFPTVETGQIDIFAMLEGAK